MLCLLIHGRFVPLADIRVRLLSPSDLHFTARWARRD
jgi:hypothetical protein